jgi:hypothetical protein
MTDSRKNKATEVKAGKAKVKPEIKKRKARNES